MLTLETSQSTFSVERRLKNEAAPAEDEVAEQSSRTIDEIQAVRLNSRGR